MTACLVALVSVFVATAAVPPSAACAGTVDPAEFGFSPDAAPEVNAAALQKALDGGGRTVRISRPGEYRLDRTVFIDDNTTLDCEKGVVLRKVGGYSQMLANRGAFNYTTNVNIAIKGLRIKANELDTLQPPESAAPGLRGHVGFVRVRNLEIRDFFCNDFGMRDGGAWRPFAKREDVGGSQYCIQVAGFDNVLIDGFDIQGGKDGIHLNCGRNFTIRNGRLCTYDDGIALNAGDWPSCTPLMGSIEDGLIENVEDLPGGSCNFARVITGCWKDWEKGVRLQRGDMVRVGKEIYCVHPMPFEENPDGTVGEHESNFAPSHRHGVWKSPDGINFLHLQGDGNVRADIRNVTFRNIRLNSRRGINNGWEINKYARMIHPDIPEKDWPTIDIAIENVVATTDFPVVDGFANAKVLMRNVRSKCPLYQERFRDDSNSVVRKGMYYRTQVDLSVEDCEFSDDVRTAPDFRFMDERGRVRLSLGRNNKLSRPLRIENKTADFARRAEVCSPLGVAGVGLPNR